jgi:hypothetical protein
MELGPMTVEIEVMGHKLSLHPISTEQLIELWDRFPVLIALLEGTDTKEAAKVAGPVAIAHVIACASGEMNDPAAVDVARTIGAGKQAEIIEKIMEITFEDGTVPFLNRIKKNSVDTLNLLNVVSAPESSAAWSASLVGDEPRPVRLRPHLVNSASG